MRSKILSVILFLSFCALARAEINESGLPHINTYVSEGVYQATNTAVVTIGTDTVIVSSYSCVIHTVNVNTAGTGSKLEIWNTKISTSSAEIEKIANIDTTAKISLIYDVLAVVSILAIFS